MGGGGLEGGWSLLPSHLRQPTPLTSLPTHPLLAQATHTPPQSNACIEVGKLEARSGLGVWASTWGRGGG